MIRTFFRIVGSDSPTERDFYSYERLGIIDPRPTPRSQRLRRGISVYSTLEHARERCRQYPHLGTHIAMIEVDDERSTVSQTGSDPLHFTIWEDPRILLESVVAVARA